MSSAKILKRLSLNVLSVLILVTNISTSIYAEEQENTIDPSPISEIEPTATPVTEEDPKDVTSSLTFSFDDAYFFEAENKIHTINQNKENTIDYSSLELEDKIRVGFDLTYAINEYSKVSNNDFFTISYFDWMKDISVSTDEIDIIETNIDSNTNTIKFTLLDTTSISNKIHISFLLNKNDLQSNTQKELKINDRLTLNFILPEMKEDVKEEIEVTTYSNEIRRNVVGSNTKTYSLYQVFYDGKANDAHPSFDTSDINISFTYGNLNETILTNDNINLLGLDAYPIITESDSGTFKQYSFDLPSTVDDQEVTYTISTTWIPENYIVKHVDMFEEKENVYIYTQDANVNYTLEILDSGSESNVYKTYDDFKDDITYHVLNGTVDISGTYDSAANTVTFIIDNETYIATPTYTDGSISLVGLPLFTTSSVELTYYVIGNHEENKYEELENEDYYVLSYNNQNVTNYGTYTDKTYSGGTVSFLIKGVKEYKATKYWLDEGYTKMGESRPEATYTLWRYYGDGNYQTAAQVYDTNGKAYTYTLKNKSASDTEDIIIYESDGSTIAKLDKYSEDGSLYMYLTRETLSGGKEIYEQVFLNTVIKDTENGKVTEITIDKRPDEGDKSVYNNGIIANRITGTVTKYYKKSWIAAAYQGDLDTVTVTLALIQTRQDGTTSTYTSVDLDNFLPETLDRTGSETVPKYDELGYPCMYEWVESKITEDGKEITLESVQDSTDKTFRLSHNIEAIQNSLYESEEHYVSSISSTMTVEENDTTVITNKLVGITTYTVDKLWAQIKTNEDGSLVVNDDGTYELQKDEEGNVTYGKSVPTSISNDPNVTVKLYRDGKEVENSTVEIHKDNAKYNNETVSSYITNRDYTFVYTDLTKYDDSGALYTYMAKEVSCDPSWHVTSEYNVEVNDSNWNDSNPQSYTFDMQMKNSPNPGDPTIIIQKDWNDGGDMTHRGDVIVGIYAVPKDVTSRLESKLIKTVRLMQSNMWQVETGYLKKEEVDLYDVYIRELAIIQNGVTYYTNIDDTSVKESDLNSDIATIFLEPIYYTLDENGYKKDPENENATIDTVNAYYHNYEVTYRINTSNGKREYIVTNKRTGEVNITVKKEWIDDSNALNLRPSNAIITLQADSDDGYSDKEITIKDGTIDVTHVLKGSQNHDRQIYTDINNTKVGTSSYTLSGSSNEEVYYFYNLPKYDSKGRVLHYEIVENVPTEKTSEYISIVETTSYTNESDGSSAGSSNKVSDEEITITNTLSGVTDLTFYKYWIDKYVSETLKERPDIYVTLYKDVAKDGKTYVEKVSPYPDRTWTTTDTSDTNNYDVSNENANWKWEFKNLEKYDENGRLINYYVVEGYNASSMEHLDYVSTYARENNYVYADKDTLEVLANVDTTKINDDETYLRLLPVNGTFVNKIENNIVINGKKVWENIPNGTPVLDIPSITIDVYQTTNKEYAEDLSWRGTEDQLVYKTDSLRPASTSDYSVSFTIDKDKNGNELPKYDNEGNLYYYALRENVEVSNNTNFETAYGTVQGQVNNYVMTNKFDDATTNKVGKIEITKSWDINTSVVDYEHPSVTFSLYQQYVSNDTSVNTNNGYTVAKKVDSITLQANSNKDDQTVSFENISLYAPNGTPYYYYVKEETISGYTSDKSISDTFTLIDGEHIKSVSFENTYTKESVDLTIQKEWDDASNHYETRPDVTTFKEQLHLYKTASKQSGANGAKAIAYIDITSELGNASYTRSDDTNIWSFTISSLEKYAPNGSLWKYVVTEGYELDSSGNKKNTSFDCWGYTALISRAEALANSNVTLKLKNSIMKKASVTKKWNVDTSLVQLNDVTVKLQFKIGTGNWLDATSDHYKSYGIQTTNSNSTNEYVLNPSNKWSITLSDLIGMTNKKEVISYRFIEIKYGNESVTTTGDTTDSVTYNLTDDEWQPTTSFTLSNKTSSTDSTTITNTLGASQYLNFTVTKVWNDNSNKYNTRPNTNGYWEVTVKLQRKLVTETEWQDIENEAKTIRGKLSENSISITYENLPKKNAELVNWEYRVVEENNFDGYTSSSEVNKTSQTITNTLETIKVEVTKDWNDDDQTVTHPSIALVIYKKNNTTGVEGKLDNSVMILDNTKTSATWNDLPKLDNEFSYVVKEFAVDENHEVNYDKSIIDGYIKAADITISTSENSKATLANAITSFTLNKNDNEGNVISQDDLELSILKDKEIVAVWAHDENGYALSSIKTRYDVLSIDKNTGMIYGLPVGTYTVQESNIPNGYLKTDDVTFTIQDDGKVTIDDEIIKDNTIELIDDVIRGQVQLTKYESDKNTIIGGITFDLYQVVDGKDVKIASNLVTDGNGVITTINNTNKFIAGSDKDKSLSIGLRKGNYYFLEVSTKDNLALDETKLEFTIDAVDGKQPELTKLIMTNEPFLTSVTVKKKDTKTGNALQGIEFTITNLDTNESFVEVTDENGEIAFELSTKGKYSLVETKPLEGYKNLFEGTFVITDSDNKKEIVLDRDRLSLTSTSNSVFYDSDTIGNTPIEEKTNNKAESVPSNKSTVTFMIPKTGVN